MKSGVAKRGLLQTPRTLLPDVETLSACLTTAFDDHDSCGGEVRILDRKQLPRMMSTSPNEVVTCQWANDSNSRVFIKYGAGQSHYSFGHRGGVAYEAEVYRRLLQPLPDFRPKCLGAPADPNSGKTWLILQYVSNAVLVSDLYKRATRQQRAMAESARWIGKFHATHEARVHEPEFSFVKGYDAEYYRGWWRRTFEFAHPLRRRFTWLNKLREAGDEWFKPLLALRPTLIHGEFYAKTILIRNRSLFVVDWESAAKAAGEIDLAALTEGKNWPVKIVRQCVREYLRSRWPDGAPAGFARTLDAARIYLHFRWLGERPDWTVREKSLWRYDHLRAAAERLGLL